MIDRHRPAPSKTPPWPTHGEFQRRVPAGDGSVGRPPREAEARGDSPAASWRHAERVEHLIQIYGDESGFLDVLEGFVAEGIENGDGVIVTATAPRLQALLDRLVNRGISLSIARSRNQLIAREAEEVLAGVLVDDWPDAARFERTIGALIARARGDDRRVRACGEMVATLWGRGLIGASVRLEHLWHDLCRREGLTRLCGYPRSGFTGAPEASLREILDAHSRVLFDPPTPPSRASDS